MITFTKGGGLWLEQIASIGVDAVGLDWTVNLAHGARACRWPGRAAGQYRSVACCSRRPRRFAREARAVLDSFGNFPGHVFNLGHGISQFTPPEHVAELVDEVHRHSRAIRGGSNIGRCR